MFAVCSSVACVHISGFVVLSRVFASVSAKTLHRVPPETEGNMQPVIALVASHCFQTTLGAYALRVPAPNTSILCFRALR